LTYSKCLNPTGYFRSPNDDTPCRQFLSLAHAVLIQSDQLSDRAALATRIQPSSDLRFIPTLEFYSACSSSARHKGFRAETYHSVQ
jgi:hypothetical protein